MEGNEIVSDALGRIQNTIRRVLDGMTPDQLYYRPDENANSTAWVIWHLSRVQDHHMSDMAGKEQLWTADGWHAKFNMEPDFKNTGTGHTPEDVAKVRPDAELLQAYHDAVYERTKEVLSGLTAADMDRELDEPQYSPLPTVGVRLASVISDNTQHAGQAAYIKGLAQGKHWMGV
jgi:hypothetical protein